MLIMSVNKPWYNNICVSYYIHRPVANLDTIAIISIGSDSSV